MRALTLCFCLVVCGSAFGLIGDDWVLFRRGDADNNGTVNVSDPIYISEWLFNGGPEPGCLNQADANNDNAINNTDVIYLINWLFSDGPAPPAPGPFATECSYDDSQYPLGCVVDPCP